MKHVVIVGGVAGGMATAARLRRLSEETNITVVERTEYISYATCGMPYYIEGKINDRSRMFVKTPEEMSKLFRVNIKTNTEAISIDRDNKKLWVRDLKLNKEYYIDYDKLVLSTGAEPYVPDIEGVDISEVYKLRNISDMDRIKSNILESKPKKAVIVGGGFIGIEMAEALRYQGLEVSLVELDKQVMTHFDREMATFIHQNLVFNGIKLFLNNSVEKFEKDNNEIKIFLKNGEVINSDIVILSLGVRPDTSLAEKSNLETGLKKAIIVNEKMLTSDPDIYAIGDAVELKDYISQNKTLMPLAGIANRQGRVVAENIAGLEKIFKKPLGTSICKVFDMTIASTGLNEKQLKKYGYDYNKVYLHPANHAGYYPDSFPMTIKLLFENKTGKILGAQIIGNDGVDKRIDTISTAIYSKLTVYDLQDIEFAYAPPYNSVKDPVNIAGNIAVNMLNNILSSINPDELDNINKENTTIINVSEKEEHANANIENSICIPLIELRDSLSQIDKNKLIITYCQMGLRGYIAYRILKENGFNVKNLVGGFKLYKAFKEMDLLDNHQLGIQNKLEEPFCSSPTKESVKMITNLELDACGLQCPGPILKLKETLGKMNNEETVKVIATDPGFAADVTAWCNRTGNQLISLAPDNGKIKAIIKRVEATEEKSSITINNSKQKTDKTIIVFSNDLDKALAAFIIANGAASMGDKVTLFFTFWGLNILRKTYHVPVKKSILDKMFGFMMPRGANKLTLSKMNMGGMGTNMMKYVMKNKNVMSLTELIDQAKINGVRLAACTMSMDVMGIAKEELIEGVDYTGVAGYLDSANDSVVNLFI